MRGNVKSRRVRRTKLIKRRLRDSILAWMSRSICRFREEISDRVHYYRWTKESDETRTTALINFYIIIATGALIIAMRAWSSRGHVSVFQRKITRYGQQL